MATELTEVIVAEIVGQDCGVAGTDVKLIFDWFKRNGYVVLPRRPTKEMCEAGNIALEGEIDTYWASDEVLPCANSTAPATVFAAMIKAALQDGEEESFVWGMRT